MNAEQLVQVAQELDPTRLLSDPRGALKNALAYSEALALLTGSTNGNGHHPEPEQQPTTELQQSATSAADPLVAIDIDGRRVTGESAARLVKALQGFLDKQGWSRSKAATVLGVSAALVNHWVNGTYRPGVGNAKKIQDLINGKETHSLTNGSEELREKFRKFRDQTDMTMMDIAKATSINAGTIYSWMAGKAKRLHTRNMTQMRKFLEQKGVI